MNLRPWAALSIGLVAGVISRPEARASLAKGDGFPPLNMPNALLVEAGEPSVRVTPRGAAGKIARAVADTRQGRATCGAAAVRTARGVQLVTARHCIDPAGVQILDEGHRLFARAPVAALGPVDLALLPVGERPPWDGLETAPSASVALGERLCAWRMHRAADGIARERICARLVARRTRPDGAPLLVVSHPYPAGTSGSPLVDPRGRVVGIVVASTGVDGLAEPIEGIDALLASSASPLPPSPLAASPLLPPLVSPPEPTRSTCDSP